MTHVKECEEMKKDLSCFTVFPEKFNGKVMYTQDKHQYNVFLDACLTGDGAFWNNDIYVSSRHLQATLHLNITQIERLNILIALSVM